ncbi:MAG: DUF2961 domain-containing protein, partial [Oscillospiraceae bacterium]|nr:DUF2961 domain-containing protein [Candidatus Equicaccousia limihippi]
MLNNLTLNQDIKTFSVSPENLTGEKGKGGMAKTGTGTPFVEGTDLDVGWKINPFIVIDGKQTAILADIKGQGAVKHIWITDCSTAGRLLILRIWFDGYEKPAVEAPLSDFFCNADYNEYRQLSSAAICFNPLKGMNCYFEMPYFKGFKIELENLGNEPTQVYYQIDCEEKQIPQNSLYFHASFHRENLLEYKKYYPVLQGVKAVS